MKKYLLLIVIPFWFLMSCSDSDEPIPEEIRNEKTLLMYMPWSSNLTSYFYQNGKTGADWDSAPEQTGTLLMLQS